MATPADIKAMFPEFCGESNTRIQLYIDMAVKQVSGACWGTLAECGITYLIAHLMTVSGNAGASGSVKSKKVGDLSITYGGNTNATDLESTGYGSEYSRLLNTACFGLKTYGEC